VDPERRLAQRYDIPEAAVEWKPGAGVSTRRRGWIRDISVTGARLVVPALEHVELGAPVQVSLDPTSSFTALVRWKQVDHQWTHCGLEYIDTTAGYRHWGLGVLTANDDTDPPQREPSDVVG
jgi:hypothetical protein